MSDDRAVEVRRAREVLATCGWVFDKYRGELMTIMMGSGPQDERERAYLKTRIITEIQGELQSIVENWDFDRLQEVRRERMREGRHAIG